MENGFVPAGQFKGPCRPIEKTASQFIWLQLRSPFLLPPNGCVECLEWEAVEFGIMGCRICGSFHVCSVWTCPVTEIESHHVCIITGAVVRSVTYDQTEYMPTVVHDTSDRILRFGKLVPLPGKQVPSPGKLVPLSDSSNQDTYRIKVRGDGMGDPPDERVAVVHVHPTKRQSVSRCLNFHERVCLRVLCSNTMVTCCDKEKLKLHNRLKWSFMRHIKELKMKRRRYNPNLIVLISKIATDIENYRLPISNDTDTLRKDLAYRCANDIYKFTSSMIASKAAFTGTIDPTTMVIGLLYLLRSGLVHKDITVLPQYRVLSHLLPPENFIHLFQVKSKIITITENIVKCHLRTLSMDAIKDIGYETLDHVL